MEEDWDVLEVEGEEEEGEELEGFSLNERESDSYTINTENTEISLYHITENDYLLSENENENEDENQNEKNISNLLPSSSSSLSTNIPNQQQQQLELQQLQQQDTTSTIITTTNTTKVNYFNYSVRIFPPPPSVLSRDTFKLMFLPAIKKVLEEEEENKTISFVPDRGWRNKKEFEKEFNKALQSRTCNLDGIIIARNQTETEAQLLVGYIQELQIQAKVVLGGNIPLLSTSLPPPKRISKEDLIISTVPCFTTLSVSKHDSTYNPEDKRHHVILYLPSPLKNQTSKNSSISNLLNNEDIEIGSTEYVKYVEMWFDGLTFANLTRILGEPDLLHSITRFTWSDRGWGSSDNFLYHTKELLKKFGYCILARKLSFHDAYVIHKRLENVGYKSSLIITATFNQSSQFNTQQIESYSHEYPFTIPSTILSSFECPSHHLMKYTPSHEWRLSITNQSNNFNWDDTQYIQNSRSSSRHYCDLCSDSILSDDSLLICEYTLCHYKLCSTCTVQVLDIPCYILFGINKNLTIKYPSCDSVEKGISGSKKSVPFKEQFIL